MCADGVANAYELGGQNPYRLKCTEANHNIQGHESVEYMIKLMGQQSLPTPSTARARAQRPWRRLIHAGHNTDHSVWRSWWQQQEQISIIRLLLHLPHRSAPFPCVIQ